MKRLVLLGGGHAHVKVLADLCERGGHADCEVHLMTPYRRQIYSGMLPGWIAGHYPIEACAISLDALARRAGVTLHETTAVALDPVSRTLHGADASRLSFEHLSIDTGPVAALDRVPGSAEHALPVRPIEGFVAAWPVLVDRILGQCQRFDLAILGSGAAGVELAFAIRRRALADGWSHLHLTLVGPDVWPLAGAPLRQRRRVTALLTQRGIRWLGSHRATHIEARQIAFEQGEPLAFDACLVVTGASAPHWPRAMPWPRGGTGTGKAPGCGVGRIGSIVDSCAVSRWLSRWANDGDTRLEEHKMSLMPFFWRRPTPSQSAVAVQTDREQLPNCRWPMRR